MPGKKQEVADSFKGLCNPGDYVRVYWDGGAIDITVSVVDGDGDIYFRDLGGSPLCESLLCANRATHIKVLKKAPPAKTKSFGDMKIDVRGEDIAVNGEPVSDEMWDACLLMGGQVDESDVDALGARQAWTLNNARLSPSGFRAGCASCSYAEFQAALQWVSDQL